jgi:hypothetical protein
MKKKYQTFLLIIFLFSTITSCGVIDALVETDEEIMESYKGSSQRELILNWGPPKQTLDDGDYGSILIYYEKEKFEGYYTGKEDPVGGRTYWKYYFFFSDTNNIIYHTLYKEEDIPPTEIEMDVYLH